MLSAAHTLISLPFAVWLTNPILIFLAAFIWHVFCDTLLHWNIYPHQFRRYPWGLVAGDIGVGLALAWAALGNDFLTLPMVAAIAGGNAPDVLHGLWDKVAPHYKKSAPAWLTAWFVFHERSQLETTNVAAGLISQIVLIAASFYLISSF